MIGNRIKSARQTRKRSQQWLADEIGVHQTSVTQWETGRTDPATENLKRLAKALNVDFEWLATGRGEMEMQYRPVAMKTAEPLPVYSSQSDEQREFLALFDKLPRGKREVLLTFMRDWVK